jgi:hypothetical protein
MANFITRTYQAIFQCNRYPYSNTFYSNFSTASSSSRNHRFASFHKSSFVHSQALGILENEKRWQSSWFHASVICNEVAHAFSSSSATSFLILVERPSLLTRRLLDNLSIILSNRRKLRRFDGEFLSEGTSQVHLSVNVGPTRNVSLKMFSALDSSISRSSLSECRKSRRRNRTSLSVGLLTLHGILKRTKRYDNVCCSNIKFRMIYVDT